MEINLILDHIYKLPEVSKENLKKGYEAHSKCIDRV